jgi:hypothetical protein
MRISTIVILLFVLSAFAIGVGLQDSSKALIDSSIDNASLVIENISFDYPTQENIPNSKGLFKIVESGVKFVGVIGFETMRAGIHFGKDNPQYFTTDFIFKVIKLIVVLVIISLLIKPAFYGIIFLVMGIMWVVDMIRKKRKFILKQKGVKK